MKRLAIRLLIALTSVVWMIADFVPAIPWVGLYALGLWMAAYCFAGRPFTMEELAFWAKFTASGQLIASFLKCLVTFHTPSVSKASSRMMVKA